MLRSAVTLTMFASPSDHVKWPCLLQTGLPIYDQQSSLILTRVTSYHSFSAQLSHCCSQLVRRQPSLAGPIYQVLAYLLSYLSGTIHPHYHSFPPIVIDSIPFLPHQSSAQGLLRYWPSTDSTKQLLFLDEMDNLLTSCKPPSNLLTPLRRKVSSHCDNCSYCLNFHQKQSTNIFHPTLPDVPPWQYKILNIKLFWKFQIFSDIPQISVRSQISSYISNIM